MVNATAVIEGAEYAIHLDPDDVPTPYIRPGGLVDVVVLGVAVDGSVYRTTTTVRMVAVEPTDPADAGARTAGLADPTIVWKDAVGTSGSIDGATLAGLAARSDHPAKRLSRVPVLTAEDDGTNDPETDDDGAEVKGDTYVELERGGDPGMCWYDAYSGVSTRQRSTTIGTTYPTRGDEARMVVASSEGAAYGEAFQLGGNAAWKSDGSRFVKTTWEKEWPHSGAQRSYRKYIEYKKYAYHCRGFPSYRGDVWRPIGETGGTGRNNGITRPNWTHCTPADGGIWRRNDSRGYAYKYGSAVKFSAVIGIDLSIRREYTTDQYVEYRFTGWQRLCGSNAQPATASKVMAKPRR